MPNSISHDTNRSIRIKCSDHDLLLRAVGIRDELRI
jgi:hypothetical protein